MGPLLKLMRRLTSEQASLDDMRGLFYKYVKPRGEGSQDQKTIANELLRNIEEDPTAQTHMFTQGPGLSASAAYQLAPLIDAEIVYIPESTKSPGQFVSWAQPLLKEIEVFPNGAHDDTVDTMTQALIYLKDSGWIASGEYEEDEEAEYVDDRRVKTNPYGA